MNNLNDKNIYICVIGLGYVGLPLAIEFNKKYKLRSEIEKNKKKNPIIKRIKSLLD